MHCLSKNKVNPDLNSFVLVNSILEGKYYLHFFSFFLSYFSCPPLDVYLDVLLSGNLKIYLILVEIDLI